MSTTPHFHSVRTRPPQPSYPNGAAPVRPVRFAHGSIWAAALCAAGCTARAAQKSYPIQWQAGDGRLRYTATEFVVIEPLGVALGPGETLEVAWVTGATGYSIRIRSLHPPI